MSGAKEASCGGWRNGGSRVRAPCIPFVPGIAETQNLREVWACGDFNFKREKYLRKVFV